MKSKNHPRLLCAAGLISLAITATASAADRTWGGGNLLYTDTSASGWNGSVPLAGDTATINSGQVNFANHDTFGSASTTTSAIINLNGGTLASNGWFTTIWNLNLNGGTLLANGGAWYQYPAFQLAGTVTVGGSQVSTINATTEININNWINIGGNGNPTLEFNVADVTADASSDLIISAQLKDNPYGAGSLTKSGAGTLSLTGENLHTGATTVSGGTLAVGAGALISDSSAVKVTGVGATYDMSGITPASDTVGSIASVAGSFILLGDKQIIAGGDGTDTTLAGSISGTSGALTKVGAGTLTVTGATNYTGATTVNGGTLVINGGANNSLSASGNVSIGAAGTLDLGGFSQTTTGVVTLTSGATLKGGTLTSNHAALLGNNFFTGTINLGAGGALVTNQRLLVAYVNTSSLTIGTGSTGSMTFGGDNWTAMNYVGVDGGNGTLNVNGGTVNFNNASSPGTGNGYLNVGSNSNTSTGSIMVNGGNINVGTWLKLGGNFSNGAGTDATSSLAITTGTVTVGGGSDTANNGVLFMNGGAGDNTVNTGNATLTLNSGGVINVKRIEAGNQGTKTINFDGGTLRAGDSSTSFLNAATGLTVNVKNGGAAIDTQAFNVTVAATLVANGTGGLTKSGSGALTLSGANTYTGDTTVAAGTLSLGDGTTNTSLADTAAVVIGTDPTAILNLNYTGTDTVASLTIDNVVKGPGIWGSAASLAPNTDPKLTGSGTLTVGAVSPYTTWANSFLPGNNVSNPVGDNDNDGLVNQQEFAFGLSPISGSSVNPIVAQLNKTTGQFSYQRRAGSGLTYKILTSTTLATGSWTEDLTAGQVAGATDGNGNQTVVVTLTGAPLAASKLFVRVAAN